MNTPFPGMDPYLEHPSLWPDVHNSLIADIRRYISPRIAPDYYVRLESRAYIVRPQDETYIGRPDLAIASPIGTLPTLSSAAPTVDDVAVLDVTLLIPDKINHYYLEIRGAQTHQLITEIELLSPVNKVNKRDREIYIKKREEILTSATNYIEIDLLRKGRPMPLEPVVGSDYRILVSRGWTRNKAKLFAFNLPAPIPDIPLALQPQDDEPLIPLNQLLHDLYTVARFDLQIDYDQPPVPPLTDAQAAWARAQIDASKK